MCGTHENLIDKKSGQRFPVHVLQSWKALHEYRTAFEHNGEQAAFGFVRSLTLDRSPLFAVGTQIDLAKTTFLIGPNGAGKSAVCEWLSVLDNVGSIERWRTSPDLEYRITFDAPAEHQLHVATGPTLTIQLDGTPVSRNYARSSAVYLPDRGDVRISCDLRRTMALLQLEELALRNLCGRVSGPFVKSLEFLEAELDEESDADAVRRYTMHCHLISGRVMAFGQLSGGEQGRVLLDLSMALADEGTHFGPTLLLVEFKSIGMDWGSIQPYLSEFASARCLYQTVLTSWELPTDIATLGWQVYEVRGHPGGTGTIIPAPLVM